jgi:hypothetical protein
MRRSLTRKLHTVRGRVAAHEPRERLRALIEELDSALRAGSKTLPI